MKVWCEASLLFGPEGGAERPGSSEDRSLNGIPKCTAHSIGSLSTSCVPVHKANPTHDFDCSCIC